VKSTAPQVAVPVTHSVATSASNAPIALDPSRIAQLQKETDAVSILLARVFTDEAQLSGNDDEDKEPADINTSDTILLGLDAEHTAFLRLLISRPSWNRQELLDAAADMEIMLDGALERINEAALDRVEEPLIEGDDPIESSSKTLEKLEL
jgi:hypothetical protein